MASMKLRVRAAAGGQTIRVQVPVLCTLQHLKTVLAPMILYPVSAIRLSLNKRDELEGPGDALLSSFGLTSGDLLYYIVNDSGRSPFPNPGLRATPNADGERRAALPTAAPDGGTAGDRTPPSRAEVSDEDRAEAAGRSPSRLEIRSSTNPISRRELCAAAADRRAGALVAGSGPPDSGPVSGDSPLPEAPDCASSPPSKKSSKRGADMGAEGDEMEPARDGDLPGHRHAVPIPYLLHRVLASEFGNVRHAPSYLVLAVHAMMLETGFVRVNAGEGSGSSAAASVGYGLPAGWSDAGVVNLTYSLPELVRAGESPASGRAVGEEALLRCRIVGNAVVVYGAVTGGSVHRVSLSVSKFLQEKAPLGRSAISGESGSSSSSGGGADGDPTSDLLGNLSPSCSAAGAENLGTNVYRDILDLWKDGKDSLSIPLLTFMCEAAGLDPPPSLLRLPTEMKLKVLDSLPPIALANVACACSELRFLAASEELWKQRYVDEFGVSSDKPPGARGWKSAFVRDFKRRKGWEEDERAAARRLNAVFPPVPFFPPFPAHFGRVDYLPGLGRTLPTDVDRFVPNPLLPHHGGPDYLPELGGTLPIDMDPLRRNALLPNHAGPFPGDRVNGGSIEGFDFGGLVPHPRFNFNGQSAPHVDFPDLRGMDRSRRSR